MREALGLLLGLVAGGLSVYSLWLITGFAGRMAVKVDVPEPKVEEKEVWAPFQWEPFEKSPTPPGSDEGALSPGVFDPRLSSETPPGSEPATDGEKTDAGRATRRLLLAFLLKAPLLVLVAFGAQSLGTAALYWCAGGVMLVYFSAVFWAAARTHRR